MKRSEPWIFIVKFLNHFDRIILVYEKARTMDIHSKLFEPFLIRHSLVYEEVKIIDIHCKIFEPFLI